MPHRDWVVEAPARDEDVTFTINGRKFVCLPYLPAHALHIVGTMPMSTGAIQMVARCLADDEQVAEFDALLVDKSVPFARDHAIEICRWLIEVYADAPFDEPSTSADGPPAAGS